MSFGQCLQGLSPCHGWRFWGSIIHREIWVCERGQGKEWLGTQNWSDLLRCVRLEGYHCFKAGRFPELKPARLDSEKYWRGLPRLAAVCRSLPGFAADHCGQSQGRGITSLVPFRRTSFPGRAVFKRNKRNKRNKPMFSGFFAIFEA